MNKFTHLLVCVGLVGLMAPLSRAQFTSARRTLDVVAQGPASGFPTVTDDPPPVVRDPDSVGSFTTSASAANPNGFQVRADITATSIWSPGQLRWNVSGFSSTTSPLGDLAGASGTGTAVINVAAPTAFEGVFPPGSQFMGIGANLRDGGGALVWQRSSMPFEEIRFPFTLPAGQYTINTSFGTLHTAGQGAFGATSFTVNVIPEPSCAALGVLAGAAALRCRGRVRGGRLPL